MALQSLLQMVLHIPSRTVIKDLREIKVIRETQERLELLELHLLSALSSTLMVYTIGLSTVSG